MNSSCVNLMAKFYIHIETDQNKVSIHSVCTVILCYLTHIIKKLMFTWNSVWDEGQTIRESKDLVKKYLLPLN